MLLSVDSPLSVDEVQKSTENGSYYTKVKLPVDLEVVQYLMERGALHPGHLGKPIFGHRCHLLKKATLRQQL